MSQISIKPGEQFEAAFRRFNRKVQNSGVLAEARRRRFYESPQARRKRKGEARRRRSQQRQTRYD